MAQNVKYVTAAKPKVTGAISVAPLGTTLPTDAVADLDPAFKSLGYIGEDGLSNANSPSIETKKAWGGDTILTSQSERPDTFTCKLVEALNPEVLKVVYGSDNVKDSAGKIEVSATSTEPEPNVFVIDTILSDNHLKRIVIPHGQLTEIGELVYSDSEALAYEPTIQALPFNFDDGKLATHKEYIQKAADDLEDKVGD